MWRRRAPFWPPHHRPSPLAVAWAEATPSYPLQHSSRSLSILLSPSPSLILSPISQVIQFSHLQRELKMCGNSERGKSQSLLGFQVRGKSVITELYLAP